MRLERLRATWGGDALTCDAGDAERVDYVDSNSRHLRGGRKRRRGEPPLRPPRDWPRGGEGCGNGGDECGGGDGGDGGDGGSSEGGAVATVALSTVAAAAAAAVAMIATAMAAMAAAGTGVGW